MAGTDWRIRHYDIVPSTMDLIDEAAAAGEAAGLVVVAAHQRAGRGRAGREWSDSPGSALLCSILLRPKIDASDLSVLPLLAGLAVAEAIEIEARLSPKLKWPNDLTIDGEKVGGILLTSRVSGDEIGHVNLGIGVNLVERAGLPVGATALAAHGVRVTAEVLLKRILQRLDIWLPELEIAGSPGVLDSWKRRAAYIGDEVSIVEAGEVLVGNMAGVDIDGALKLQMADGMIRRVVSGDLVRGPRTEG